MFDVAVLDPVGEYEALTQFMYLAPIGLAQTSMSGEIVMINPLSAQLLLPLATDGNLTNLFDALQHVAPDLRALVASFADTHGPVCEALRIQVSAGERGKSDPQVLSLNLLKLDEERLMAVLSDVSLQVKRERQLKQSEAWLNALLVGVTDYALVGLDASGCVDHWNASIGRVTGFECEAVLGQPFSIFYPEGATTPDRVRDRLNEADDNGWSLDDGWRRRADGTQFWGSAMITPVRDRHEVAASSGEAASSYCLVIRDITEQRVASDQHHRAHACDHLTGIANRRAFFGAAELEVERWQRSPRPLSMILFDIDHFKRVNDTHGHPAGDAVLRHLAALLAVTFRLVDVVARVGGEEFAVLLPSTDGEDAAAVADRLRAAIEAQTVDVDGHSIRFTLSGGVASMDASVAGLDALMKRADLALYAAKAAGRNRIECWQPPQPDGSAATRAAARAAFPTAGQAELVR